MIGLILSAGKGTRISNDIAYSNKCLIIKDGIEIIKQSIINLSKMDIIKKIVIVVNYQADEIINCCGNKTNDIEIRYVYQKKLKGILDGINSAKSEIGNEDFILLLGDEYYKNPYYGCAINEFYEKQYDILVGTVNSKDLENVRKTYSIQTDNNMNVLDIVEKPIKPFNNIMGTGCILFRNDILNYINLIKKNKHFNEMILVDLIKYSIKDNRNVKYINIADQYVNVNTLEELKLVLQL